jgi:hypothetical protein
MVRKCALRSRRISVHIYAAVQQKLLASDFLGGYTPLCATDERCA